MVRLDLKRPSAFLAGLIAALAVTLMPGCAAPHSTGDAVATGMQNAIVWPEGYLPGTTNNFVSNEVIVAGLRAADVWPLLADATKWPSYYANSADVRFYDGKGPVLADGDSFFFKTFGFPVEAQVTEYVPPANGQPGRVAWHGWAGEESSAERLDVIHAWLVEDLPGGRVRVLTQESQKGKPAQELAASKPNIMINGHQDWLIGLVDAARKNKAR
ncbi:SRPBCC family protein [Pseudomonas palmensis]|uniref:SRPBCC domain-containing protein n=1 Tax=Pseudomonas palmensis TaxID=2815362 RepID=UPI001F2F04C9|nr:SRPBCC domain-containing protein [Pseudomonas palmensis]